MENNNVCGTEALYKEELDRIRAEFKDIDNPVPKTGEEALELIKKSLDNRLKQH